MDINSDKNTVEKRFKKRKLLGYLFLNVLVTLILSFFLIQWSPVQNKIVNYITRKISKRIDGEVLIDHVDIDVFSGLKLRGFLLADSAGDTVVSAASLRVDLASGLSSLYYDNIDIDRIYLKSPRLNIIRKRGEKMTNLAMALKSLSKDRGGEANGESSTKFKTRLDWIRVDDADIRMIDQDKGENYLIRLDKGIIDLESAFEDGEFSFDEISLWHPVVSVVKSRVDQSMRIKSNPKNENPAPNDFSFPMVFVKKIHVVDGNVIFDDQSKRTISKKYFDYNHLDVSRINLDAKDLVLSDMDCIHLELDRFSFDDGTGRGLSVLKCDHFDINPTGMEFSGINLRTGHSRIGRVVKLAYNSFDDFSSFETKVKIYGNLKNSKIDLGDLLHFIPSLRDKGFFVLNQDKVVDIDGVLSGTIDRLKGMGVILKIEDQLLLDSDFAFTGLSKKGEELLDVDIRSLESNMSFLKSFIPGFNPPENFNKLGTIGFVGQYSGAFEDFSVNGHLNSVLGNGFLDLHLDVKNGSRLAKYSGEMRLNDFDLRTWTGNDDFGKVSFNAHITDGKGLTLDGVKTKIYGAIDKIDFKGYEYKNFEVDADIEKNIFNGEFVITDPNIDLVFNGNIKMENGVPFFDFKADIENIDLYKLHILGEPAKFKGYLDINLKGKDIDHAQGYLMGNNLRVYAKDTFFLMDSLLVDLKSSKEGRSIALSSDIVQGQITGKYNLRQIIPSLELALKKGFPQFTQKINISSSPELSGVELAFNMDIADSKNFFRLLGLNGLTIKDHHLEGIINNREEKFEIRIDSKEIRHNQDVVKGQKLRINLGGTKEEFLISVDSIMIGNIHLPKIVFTGDVYGDSIEFALKTESVKDSLLEVDIGGEIQPENDGYFVSFDDGFTLMGQQWKAIDSSRHSIFLMDEYHDAVGLRYTNGIQELLIGSRGGKGIELSVMGFDLASVDKLINYKKMHFSGKGSVEVNIPDLYDFKKAGVALGFPDFRINGDSFGPLIADVGWIDKDYIDVDVNIGHPEKGLEAKGHYDTRRRYLDLDVTSKQFSLVIFEYLLKDGIKDTRGGVDLQAKVWGKISDLKIKGEGYLSGQVTVVYTGGQYFFEHQMVRVTERMIDLTGAVIIDKEGGRGIIRGGLKHYLFDDFVLDANISGENVIALNTTKRDNPLYYGFGKGNISVDFTGPFHLVNIDIIATTGPGSVINIPVSDGEGDIDKSFIQFVSKADVKAFKSDSVTVIKSTADYRLEGLDIEIDLTMTPDALVNIIFDESRGDIITGTGRGHIKMNITRYGDFDMYGTYEIERGQYLFTALGAVAKPFDVRRGGEIRWTGDPINAVLDIEADYSVRTSLETFLAEFVTPGSPLEAASRSLTQVDLILKLGGTLFSPAVNFDLQFPNIDGNLRTVVDSKMRILKANQAELNNQVLGLIVINSFLPTGNAQNIVNNANIGSTGLGTLSEFVSSQLSNIFSGLLNEALVDDGIIKGIDFDIGFRQTTFLGLAPSNNGYLPDQINLNLKNRFNFLDERLSLDLGGDYVRDNFNIGTDYFIGNFVINYFLTPNKKLNLRVYGRYDYDEFYRQRRQKYGIGLRYRSEFGSLYDFQKSIINQKISLNENPSPEG